jgi:hypothetical protein
MFVTSDLVHSSRVRGVVTYLLLLGAAIVLSLAILGSMAAGRTSGAAIPTEGMTEGLVQEALARVAAAVQYTTARMLRPMIDAVLDAFQWVIEIARDWMESLVLTTGFRVSHPSHPSHLPLTDSRPPFADYLGRPDVHRSLMQAVSSYVGGEACF